MSTADVCKVTETHYLALDETASNNKQKHDYVGLSLTNQTIEQFQHFELAANLEKLDHSLADKGCHLFSTSDELTKYGIAVGLGRYLLTSDTRLAINSEVLMFSPVNREYVQAVERLLSIQLAISMT